MPATSKTEETNHCGQHVLGKRDLEILETLTLRVRLMSVAQVARTWWPDTNHSLDNAGKRLKDLEAAGFITRVNVMARPELPLIAPIACWRPGLPAPDFGALSYQLLSRWVVPPVYTACVIASATSGYKMGGGGGRLPRMFEATHDISFAQVYLRMKELEPERAKRWYGEEWIKRNREIDEEKLPDAIITACGRATDCAAAAENGDSVFARATAIEFGGTYSKRRLIEFHEYCARKNLPYELW